MQRVVWIEIVFALLLLIVPSCTHSGGMGDRAFEAEEYSSALRYYEEEMVKGAHDWHLYHRAAQAATRLGSFATAERYFSLSLRYGGGIDVATDLATFYLQTSNYARAVRVYQFLLKHSDDPQPIYNNLGTALMYAGLPFDAESYLMIAQQMEPKNPLPYINLGVLYDQHMKQPQLAHAMFVCFMELSKGTSESTRVVKSRLEEMKLRPYSMGKVEGFVCGEPYVPVQRSVGNLKQYFEGPEWQDDEGSAGSTTEKVIELGGGDVKDGEPADKGGSHVIIDRGTGSIDSDEATVIVDIQNNNELETLAVARGRAQVALIDKKYADVVRELANFPVETLTADDMFLLGTAFARNGRTKDAVSWMEWSFKRESRADTLESLLNLYLILDETERVNELCKRYGDNAEYKSATKRCKVASNGE